ncbi:MAG: hypothetical protein PHP44_11100 [Kiritimatiellae bacterium]|nr:hypothetical protein [Kiritimatiellia bacterium]
MKNEKWKMKKPLSLIGACLVLVSLTGCISLGSPSATTATNVSRMEIWVHTVEGTNAVFEVSATTNTASSLGNGTVELQDMQSILNSVMSIYNSIPEDQREKMLSALLKMAGALAAQ